ncbi:MAG: type II toxin-antitoxin system VapC family toxin [Bryobacterales bacterium]|nr:type II toxin-antitoxin system VapC family toxin [Bryobacterales bacterium]MBV9396877.1 type II toxin-antitoxin system VapC family toxin [Bryobacterales bacterium]
MFLADTHIWYRWRAAPKKLSDRHVRALNRAERNNEAVAVSAISLWELAMLAASGKIRVNPPLGAWVEDMADDPLVSVLPLTPAIAATSVGLTALPGDPADRLIAATALCHELTLLTVDERIINWGGVPVL